MASPAKTPCCDVSRELLDAIAREDWTEVKNILSESSRHVADIVITQLISKDQWSTVRRVIICVEDEDRTWNIEGIVVKSSILLSIAKRYWYCLKESHSERFPDSTFEWIIRQVCTRAPESEVVQFVLYCCADDRLDCVLTILVERRLWRAVMYVLKRGVSDSSKRLVVLEVCACCKSGVQDQVLPDILLFCAVDQADCVLTTLVERRQWLAVEVMLKKGVSDSNKQWAVQEACKHCADNFRTVSPPWRSHSPSDEEYGLRMSFYSPGEHFLVHNILPHCADDQADCVLTTLVERRLWLAVEVMLKKGVSDSNKQWAVREACKHCKDDLGTSDSRWSFVSPVEHNIFHCERNYLDNVDFMSVRSQSYVKYDSPIEQFFVNNILPHCADNQLDSVLTTLVERRQWRAVLYVLKRGVSDSSKRWVVLEVCACCESVEKHESSDILLFCANDQADCVLTTLVERRQWRAVGEMLKKGVSDSNKQWAVQEACNNCKQDDVGTDFTRSRFQFDHWEEATRISQRWDNKVMKMKKKKENENEMKMKEYDSFVEQFLLQNILPHCADDQLDSVLATLVERRLWQAVLYVLKRGVSDSSKHWVVLKVCACCEFVVQEHELSEILLLCVDDHADFVLTTLVERLQWRHGGVMLKLVVELLKQGVSETLGTRLVEEAWKAAKSDDFIKFVLPRCSLIHLISAMPNIVKQGEQTTVDIVMQKHARDMETESFVLPRWYVDVLPLFVEHGLWNYVQTILHSVVMKSLYHWVTQEGERKEDDSVLWAIVNTCRVNATCAVRLFRAVKEETESKIRVLPRCVGLTENVCELLYTSFLDQVCVALCSEGKKTDVKTDSIQFLVLGIYTEIVLCLQAIPTSSVRSDKCEIPNTLAVLFKLGVSPKIATLNKLSSSPIHLLLHILAQLNLYCTYRKEKNSDDEVLLMMFAVLPLSPVLQSVALRIMLRQERWDVISQADLSGVWEQDRRHLLQAAVKQRQWSVVKRWADHTLYDDQRVWALNEALNEKQWDVALLLADHGLTDIDLMRVHYRLAKYADWNVILHMFERGADVAEVQERLGRMKDNKRISETSLRCIFERYSRVRNLVKIIQIADADALMTACHQRNWIVVLFTLIRNPSKESVRCALKIAIMKKVWHVVMQLVKVGMDAKQRHSLFSRMLKRQQWGVCRVLLEQGLSVQLCLKVLPKVMETNQWTLVARVMEHDVGDDVRQQVMQRAWERREGSVVWLCIKSLPTPLSVEEREALFQRAFTCEMWQVIKPLVEEKDETGIRHRDTALLEAIDQHQWDLVDHCQRHHADINMKDDDSHTPLQRAAMKKDWAAVEELVVRDGDLNLMDRDGYTVLYRVLEAKEWRIAKLLIEYQADIHKEQKSLNGDKGETPLGMLIDARRVDIIDHSLLWCPDQSKGVNAIRETALHVACLSGCYDSMYNLVARGVHPLAVTKKGHSALVYAVQHKDCPQRMVAECIRLGFSTHQPKLTKFEEDLTSSNVYYRYDQHFWFPKQEIFSPFLCALLRGLPVVTQMLYESGACSQRELFRLFTELPKLVDPSTAKGRKLQKRAGHDVDAYQNIVTFMDNIALPYLTEIATTPRSLESTCRVVISHCLTLSKTRHRDVDQLPLTERMKNFVLFSDLTDPEFGKDTT